MQLTGLYLIAIVFALIFAMLLIWLLVKVASVINMIKVNKEEQVDKAWCQR